MATECFLSRLHSVRRLSSDQLAAKVEQLTAQKHALDAELLLCLSEIERRRLYREQACSSLFEFCVIRLGHSEDVAYKRVGAARLMLAYPEIYELLAKGRIHLTGLMLLKPHLTPANHQDWLLAALGKSKRQLEKLIATRFPQPDAPSTIRKLPARKAQALTASEPRSEAKPNDPPPMPSDALLAAAPHASTTETSPPQSDTAPSIALDVGAASSDTAPSIVTGVAAVGPSTAQSGTAQSLELSVAAVGSSTAHTEMNQPGAVHPHMSPSATPNGTIATRIDPLSSHSYRVVFTANERLMQKLERARELLSHAIAPNDLPAILERALDQLIDREERRRYGTHAERAGSNRPVGAAGASELARKNSDCEASKRAIQECESHAPCQKGQSHSCAVQECESHAPCQKGQSQYRELQDPDPNLRPRSPASGREHIEAGEGRSQCAKSVPEQIQEPPATSPEADAVDEATLPAKLRSRYVPAAVRREVWNRDEGQCTFVDHAGRRCEQRHFLEMDHCEAFAIGGDATVENLRLRCRAHNAYEAEKLFGRSWVESAIAHAKQARAG